MHSLVDFTGQTDKDFLLKPWCSQRKKYRSTSDLQSLNWFPPQYGTNILLLLSEENFQCAYFMVLLTQRFTIIEDNFPVYLIPEKDFLYFKCHYNLVLQAGLWFIPVWEMYEDSDYGEYSQRFFPENTSRDSPDSPEYFCSTLPEYFFRFSRISRFIVILWNSDQSLCGSNILIQMCFFDLNWNLPFIFSNKEIHLDIKK